MFISPGSRDRFADLAAQLGTLGLIDRWFEGEDFTREKDPDLPDGGQRRALVDAYESRIDWTDEAQNIRVLRVYARALDEVGSSQEGPRTRQAELLTKSLRRDGAEADFFGDLVVPPAPAPRVADMPLESFERLRDPSVLQAHLGRIEHGIRDDPAAAIGSSKELVESVCKIILGYYAVYYDPRADLLDLYKEVATTLKLRAESVPESAKGSQSAQKALRSLVVTVQSLAELRNELGALDTVEQRPAPRSSDTPGSPSKRPVPWRSFSLRTTSAETNGRPASLSSTLIWPRRAASAPPWGSSPMRPALAISSASSLYAIVPLSRATLWSRRALQSRADSHSLDE